MHSLLRTTAFAGTLAVIATSCGRTAHGPIDGQRAYDHTARIVGIGPRQPGSDGIRQVADYIASQLRETTGLELRRQTFMAPDKAEGIEFQNLWLEIPGRLSKAGATDAPILALAAHYDSKITHPGEQDFIFLGALDAAASCAVLIELAQHIAEQQPIGPDIWVIFFDGEESIDWEWNHDRSLIGSTHFANEMHKDAERFPDGLAARMKCLVLLDLLGDRELKIDRDTESNSKLLQLFAKVATELGRESTMYAYRSPMTDDHLPFKNLGVRTIDLIDFAMRDPNSELRQRYPEEAAKYTPWWHTPDDTMENVSVDSLQFVGDLVWRALPRIDAEFYDATEPR